MVVEFSSDADLSLARQSEVLEAIRESALPVSLVMILGPGVNAVDLKFIAYWLDALPWLQTRLSCLAFVAPRSGLRLAARGFAMACSVRQMPFPSEVFADRPAAEAWAIEHLVVRLAS